MARETNIHAGHRGAMRRKLLGVGADAFHAHELIEMLLYYSIPLCDTNPTAHRLIERLGGLDRVLKSDVATLCSVKGVGASSAKLISLIRPIGLRAEAAIEESNERGVCDYETYLHSSVENGAVRLLLLDAAGGTVANVRLRDFSAGVVSEISRDIVKNALDYRASVAVLLHRCDELAPRLQNDSLDLLCSLRDALSLVDVRLADCVLLSGTRMLRVSRACPECLYSSPDVFDSFRAPLERTPEGMAGDLAMLAELLVYAGISDTEALLKPLQRLGHIGHFMKTPASELIRLGLPERAALLVSLVLALYARGEIDSLTDAPLVTAEEQAAYFSRHYVGVQDERLSLLLLDEGSRPIKLVSFGDGGVGNTSLDLRRIVELALFHRATSVALAHNHPAGTRIPSAEDIAATRALESALISIGVMLDEHYVLTGRGFTPIRLYAKELATIRPPSFYGEQSFREIRHRELTDYSPMSRLSLRENEP